ncbi:LexA family transcriptional regulator [Salinivibrio socompensis]|uniref:LexA family transcriptional regulator n=1 Tax=Salinivibrio socompensis TaxID=1510206 RepID=UPI000471CE9E|nr:XRE family transcriptional regulator [Salinivibrio socompensis]
MNADYREEVAQRIKEQRQGEGLTTGEAALRAGVGQSRWLNWECALRIPKMDLLPTIAKAINTTPAHLAGWEPAAHEKRLANFVAPKGENVIALDAAYLTANGVSNQELILTRVIDDYIDALNRDDLALIDTETKAVEDAQYIYAIAKNEHVIFRYIRQELGGGFTIYADNKTHAPAQNFSADEFQHLEIIGKVVGHWRFVNQ